MPTPFVGSALPLDSAGVASALNVLGAPAPALWSVLSVETGGKGFLPDRRPVILFERHIFSAETKGRFDQTAPDISNPSPGGYGASGANQYLRLGQALALDRAAALRCASWGIGQIMGMNAGLAGFPDVETMVAQLSGSEAAQLLAMARFIVASNLDGALHSPQDWPRFARGYNGKDYAKNHYDTNLADAYNRYTSGTLPDLTVRAAQLYLVYLGYFPGAVDGQIGKLTRSALNEFQTAHGLPLTDRPDEGALAALRAAVVALPD